ncbi:MAG: ABC transporter ATP-binding protein [Vulcanimicrobiota bacterium]
MGVAGSTDNTRLLEVEKLSRSFSRKGGILSGERREMVKAVDEVSFTLAPRETLGLVGESGCGKTTLGRLILRLIEPSGGRIIFKGRDILTYDQEKLRSCRKQMQIIFQDPYSSLNPRMTVRAILQEPLAVHGISPEESREWIDRLLCWVGLGKDCLSMYPHQFSGGQRQRIGIARALSLQPELVVADEPVSALDVSIQAQVINLLLDLQEKLSLSYIFISHDISVVRFVSHRVAVMYLGRIVESGEASRVCENPLHPYTKTLISAVPDMSKDSSVPRVVNGELPNPVNPPLGCHYHPRCQQAREICRSERPEQKEVESHHFVSCFDCE